MVFGPFLNFLLVAGLAAIVIPPIIHLLTRKRYDKVDWAAMQFLRVSERTRRKIFLEELLLMLLRMGLLAIFVLMLMAPFVRSRSLAKWGGRGNRDVVLIFDGSYSMGYEHAGTTAHDAARKWAGDFVGELAPGDGVAILQAKQQVVPVLPTLSTDFDQVRTSLQNMPPPRGGADWPGAVQEALRILAKGNRPEREIVILGDNQRFGWSDESTLLRWELLANRLDAEATIEPRIWVANLDPNRPANPANWAVSPLRASRAVAAAGREVAFKTSLRLRGSEDLPVPGSVKLQVDGRPAGDLRLPGARLDKGQIPLTFKHRFPNPGSHLVSLSLDKDALPGDNRQDLAVEVLPALPVLLIDGDDRTSPKVRGTDFLRDALAPLRDPNPSVLVRVVPVDGFDPSQLTRDLSDTPNTAPRVVVLHNLPRLTPSQQEGIDRFLADRGGVLVTLGERADAKAYNEQLFRGGQGWLPAQLVEPVGVETDLVKAARPLPASFFHPTVEMFRDVTFGSLSDARFPRRWKVATQGASMSTAIATMTGGEPLLVERPYRNGRVILATVPIDNSWRTNLTDLPAFVPLAHELVYYLAGARSGEINLTPGQPIRYRPGEDSPPGVVSIQPPDGEAKTIKVASWPFTYDDTREPGVYRLTTPGNKVHYYVVQPDERESDLAPNLDADRAKVADFVPNLTYYDDPDTITDSLTKAPARRELWLVALLVAVGLLFVEIWMTRRMALARSS